MINQKDIIGIFDIETTSVSKNTRDFLSKAQKEGKIIDVTEELPKSFVIVSNNKKNYSVYISQISTATLKKRKTKGI